MAKNESTPKAAVSTPAVTCQVKQSSPGTFQAKANIAVTVQLSDAPGTPAAKCSFNGISIFPAGSTVAVPGQPTSITATEFTMTLPVAKYHVAMGLVYLPGCGVVFAYEKCTSAQPACLDTMIPQVPSGIFVIEVI